MVYTTNYAWCEVYLVKPFIELVKRPILRAPLPGRIRDCAPWRRKGFTCTTWDCNTAEHCSNNASGLQRLGVSNQHFHDPAVLLIMSTQHVLTKDSGSDIECIAIHKAVEIMAQAIHTQRYRDNAAGGCFSFLETLSWKKLENSNTRFLWLFSI